jgi:hypothetical protein
MHRRRLAAPPEYKNNSPQNCPAVTWHAERALERPRGRKTRVDALTQFARARPMKIAVLASGLLSASLVCAAEHATEGPPRNAPEQISEVEYQERLTRIDATGLAACKDRVTIGALRKITWIRDADGTKFNIVNAIDSMDDPLNPGVIFDKDQPIRFCVAKVNTEPDGTFVKLRYTVEFLNSDYNKKTIFVRAAFVRPEEPR